MVTEDKLAKLLIWSKLAS